VDGNTILIRNSGPAISPRDYETIFEQGFSRKPKGRGLGLFISKKALRKEGMDISVDPTTIKTGVTFRIKGPNEQNTSNESD
jgi:signal transduction histidine kinase